MPRASTLLALFALLALSACPPPPPDDDDVSGDDDDATAADDDDVVVGDDDDMTGDDDDAVSCYVELSGEVIAIDRESGAVLGLNDYHARAGGLILYVLPDVGDLSVIHTKDTMVEPGFWEAVLTDCSASVEVVAVVDENRDFVIGSTDVAREHAFNPVLLPTTGQVTGIDVYVDLPRDEDDTLGDDDDSIGTGGDDDDSIGTGDDDDSIGTGNDDDDSIGTGDDDDDASNPKGDDDDSNGLPGDGICPSTFDGDIVVTDLPLAPVVATANSGDYLEGPWAVAYLDEPGDWTMEVACDADLTSFIGILDADENLFFEPSDPTGISDNNPWNLGLAPTNGVHIEIPSVEGVPYPSPAPYEGITGVVVFDEFLTGNIIVKATAVHTEGQLYSSLTLAAPGPFQLIAPPGSTDVLVWAVLDDNSDGLFDVYVDPFDSYGPEPLGDGLSGITLDLGAGPPVPGTISGEVLYPDGVSQAADCQVVALFDTEPFTSSAVPVQSAPVVYGPTWPFPYEFSGVMPGQYWVAAYLDGDCDSTLGPQANDPRGAWTGPCSCPRAAPSPAWTSSCPCDQKGRVHSPSVVMISRASPSTPTSADGTVSTTCRVQVPCALRVSKAYRDIPGT